MISRGEMKVGQTWTFHSANTVEVEGEVVVENLATGEILTLTEGQTYWWPGISFKVLEVRSTAETT